MTDTSNAMAALEAAMKENGITKADVARACGISDQAVGKWFKTGKVATKNLAIAARLCGLTLDQLVRGEIQAVGTRPDVALDSVHVPLLDVSASMGNGRMMLEYETVVDGIRLSRTWCSRHLSVSHVANLATITAYGDSMRPTFEDGDLLLVDRGVTELRIDAVYVLAYRDELYIKRVQRRLDGSVVVRSDNPLYEPIVIDPQKNHLAVLGRVVWAWRGTKL